tara:strand:- start:287 stop:1204 length:918 start_codon:yes stop_codon:yes gene_type:complete
MDIDTQLNMFDGQRNKGENWTIGVETECLIPQDYADQIDIGDYHCGEPVYDAPRFNNRRWCVEHDSSVHSRNSSRYPCEFVSPVLVGQQGLENVVAFHQWLRSLPTRVNNSCGLHIHVGIDSVIGQNASAARVINFVTKVAHLTYRWQDALYAQCGTRRDRNHYCGRIPDESNWVMNLRQEHEKPDTEKDRHNTHLNRLERYHPVNLQNLNGKGTIEFRAFAGTINKAKILHHLWSVYAIIHNAKRNVSRKHISWEQKSAGQGRESLKWFYHHLGRNSFLPIFRNNFTSMRRVAERMAEQYDQRC